jgi:hypothetical protein
MRDEADSSMTGTYVAALLVELLVIVALWALGWYFGG